MHKALDGFLYQTHFLTDT